MAKIKKRKLRWKSSGSPQVIGYKLYWAEDGNLGYHSPNIDLGNVTEIVLPDDVPEFNAVKGPVELGIAAVDEMGNESDLSVLSAPYQFNVPQAPERFWIETLEAGQSSDLDKAEDECRPPSNEEVVDSAPENLRDDQEDAGPEEEEPDDRMEENGFSGILIRDREIRQV